MRWDEMRWWRHDVLMSRGRHAALLSRGHVTTVSCHDDVMPWIWCHVMNTMPRWCHIMNKSCDDDVMSRWCHANMMSCHEYDVTMMSYYEKVMSRWWHVMNMMSCHEHDVWMMSYYEHVLSQWCHVVRIVMSWIWCHEDGMSRGWWCHVATMKCCHLTSCWKILIMSEQ